MICLYTHEHYEKELGITLGSHIDVPATENNGTGVLHVHVNDLGKYHCVTMSI